MYNLQEPGKLTTILRVAHCPGLAPPRSASRSHAIHQPSIRDVPPTWWFLHGPTTDGTESSHAVGRRRRRPELTGDPVVPDRTISPGRGRDPVSRRCA